MSCQSTDVLGMFLPEQREPFYDVVLRRGGISTAPGRFVVCIILALCYVREHRYLDVTIKGNHLQLLLRGDKSLKCLWVSMTCNFYLNASYGRQRKRKSSWRTTTGPTWGFTGKKDPIHTVIIQCSKCAEKFFRSLQYFVTQLEKTQMLEGQKLLHDVPFKYQFYHFV